MSRSQQKRKFAFPESEKQTEHTFTQIKPKLSDPNPETTISAWFLATHPNVPLNNDNFKSEDSLDSYLGLTEEPKSLHPSREPEFLMKRPCQQRQAVPTSYPTRTETASYTSNYPTSYLGNEYHQQQAAALAYNKMHSNYASYQTQTGYLYPAERNLRAAMNQMSIGARKDVHSFQFPSSMGETSEGVKQDYASQSYASGVTASKHPQRTPPSQPPASNGWVTYEYEYDRERLPKSKKQQQQQQYRFAPTQQTTGSHGYHPCLMHSKRVSMLYNNRDPARALVQTCI